MESTDNSKVIENLSMTMLYLKGQLASVLQDDPPVEVISLYSKVIQAFSAGVLVLKLDSGNPSAPNLDDIKAAAALASLLSQRADERAD